MVAGQPPAVAVMKTLSQRDVTAGSESFLLKSNLITYSVMRA